MEEAAEALGQVAQRGGLAPDAEPEHALDQLRVRSRSRRRRLGDLCKDNLWLDDDQRAS